MLSGVDEDVLDLLFGGPLRVLGLERRDDRRDLHEVRTGANDDDDLHDTGFLDSRIVTIRSMMHLKATPPALPGTAGRSLRTTRTFV